jgi:hypothetical protein
MSMRTTRPVPPSLAVALTVLLAGCASPEDGRPRGGGRGADGGNYLKKPVHAPSKIDSTRSVHREPR